MIKRLVERPVAVTMVLIALLIVGSVAIGRIPVSLMPDMDIPQVTIQVTMNGASAREIDGQIIKPLRLQLIQIPQLADIRCDAEDGGGSIFLQFDYNSDIDLNYIEVNEKIDKVYSLLPRDMERPKVIKASATDIPAFFINLTLKDGSIEKFIELGRFATEVVSRRIEQVPEVAMVDITGVIGTRILVEPDMGKLKPLGMSVQNLEAAIKSNNVVLGNLSIKDGHYRWNISFDSRIKGVEDLEKINIQINGRIYPLTTLAKITEEPVVANGMALQGNSRAICMAVIKQADARMDDLKSNLQELLVSLEKEYPYISFTVTRNQTELLDYSIDNLKSNILVGAVLALIIIFIFLNDYKSPLLVFITIPISLVVSLLVLYVLGISINIISLSGLILGLGMMVDNSIIVIDNITQFWQRGHTLKDSAVKATLDVIAPMLSSVLTTCSVFVPLIFMSGISGALFYDQAMAVTIALFVSLLVSVLVIPVYYRLIYSRSERFEKRGFIKIDIGLWFAKWYEKGLKYVLRHIKMAWSVFVLICLISIVLFRISDKAKLPPITHSDIIFNIDWNSQLTLDESKRRCENLMAGLEQYVKHYDLLIGKQQFMLSHSGDIGISQAKFYIESYSPDDLEKLQTAIVERIMDNYHLAKISFEEPANIFNTIFADNQPPLIAMISRKDSKQLDPDKLNNLLASIKGNLPHVYFEPVLWQEQRRLIPDAQMMALYGLDYTSVHRTISAMTKENVLFSIKSGTNDVPVVIGGDTADDILSLCVKNSNGVDIPLSYVFKERIVRDLKNIVSGKDGDYYPLNVFVSDKEIKDVEYAIRDAILRSDEYSVEFSGAYYSNRKMIAELAVILVVSLLLLFFILAAQFESLVQPFIIMAEILADITGALFALLIAGSGINIMSLIGIVVMCGIIINDSILKVDTINKLSKEYSLIRAIMGGGARRLNSILMTSLTTILAIAPFLVRGNIGADLQFPLSVALIGGMVFGTVVSLFFIPVLYYTIYNKRKVRD